MMTLFELVEQGKKRLQDFKVPEADLNAWYLFQYACKDNGINMNRSTFYIHKEEQADDKLTKRYKEVVEKRTQRIPLEYITGETEFMGITFEVNENVLIPRQDTETLVEYVYSKCNEKRVLDMCTGSGCIGLSIGVLAEPSKIVLCDISEGALEVAKTNLLRLKSAEDYHFTADVTICQGDLFEHIEGVFDLIVSNPPYIETAETQTLMPEVKDNEPMGALDGGPDGLYFYRKIVKKSLQYLTDKGILCFEIGYNQGESVSELMREHGFVHVVVIKDLAGNDRVVTGNLNK